MALGWKWQIIDDSQTKLDQLIRLLNVRLPKLATALSSLFSSIQSVNTFANGAATPSVFGSSMWKTNNSGATVITNFTDGVPGQEFTLWAADANTTVKNNANIITKSGADIVLAATGIRRFATLLGTIWREV